MLEHSGRRVSIVQSLRHRSFTTLPRKARFDCIGDATIDVAQFLLVPGELIAEQMTFIVDSLFEGILDMYLAHLLSSMVSQKPEDVYFPG